MGKEFQSKKQWNFSQSKKIDRYKYLTRKWFHSSKKITWAKLNGKCQMGIKL